MRKTIMWTLGFASAGLVVAGMLTLSSYRLVGIHEIGPHRAYVGLGLFFAGAALVIPLTSLIAERPSAPGRTRGSDAHAHERPAQD